MYKFILTFVYFKQRNDVIELVNHEAMMAQLREDLLLQNEQAIMIQRKQFEQKKTYERQIKSDEKIDDQVIT